MAEKFCYQRNPLLFHWYINDLQLPQTLVHIIARAICDEVEVLVAECAAGGRKVELFDLLGCRFAHNAVLIHVKMNKFIAELGFCCFKLFAEHFFRKKMHVRRGKSGLGHSFKVKITIKAVDLGFSQIGKASIDGVRNLFRNN